MCDRPRDTELLSLDQLHKTPSSACGDLPLGRAVEGDEVITEAIRPCNPPGAFCARHWPTRSTYARHRMRHGIRHTTVRAGRGLRRYVANGRLRHMRIGYARVSKADGSSRWTCSATRDAWVALPMGGVAPVGQTVAIDPFLTASQSTGLLTGQGEHGLSHPTLEAVVVHELLEQFGIILDERRHDTSERLAVLNASIVLIGVLASVLERSVLGE